MWHGVGCMYLDEGLEFTARPQFNNKLCKSSSVELIEQLEDDTETDPLSRSGKESMCCSLSV